MFSTIRRWLSRRPSKAHDAAHVQAHDPFEEMANRPLSLDAQLAIANRRLTETAIRANVREVTKRFREAASSNPASLWALSIVDPYDWALDSPDFYPGFGASGWGVPWLLNNQGRGDVLPVYINEYGLKLIRDWSRKILAFNEFAINAVENRINYIVGKGFQYTVLPKKKQVLGERPIGENFTGVDARGVRWVDGKPVKRGEGAAQTQPPGPMSQEQQTESPAPDPRRALAAKAQAVLDEFVARERWSEREQECVKRCDRDGEAILRFFRRPGGRTAVRFVEPEHLTDGKGQELKNGERTNYGVVTEPDDIEDVRKYLIVEDPTFQSLPAEVEPDQILHIKLNTDFDAKRGLPTLFAVRKNLERADKLLRNMSIMGQVQATFAVIRKHKGYAPSSVSAFQQGQQDISVSIPPTGRDLSVKQYFPGSVVDSSDKTEFEFPNTSAGAPGLVEVLKAELRAIAARMNQPEWMLAVDASNGNFAGQLVSGAPCVENFKRLQCFYARRFGEGDFGAQDGAPVYTTGVMWRVLYNAVEGGLLPREALTELEIQAEGPSITVVNKAAETMRAAKLHEAGILSAETWSKWEGVDRQQELSLGAKPQQKQLPGGLGGGGGPGGGEGGVPKAAPPGSAEGGAGPTSESLLREDEGRWITIGGSKGKDGERHGGSPVFIKDGKIVKGAPALAGKSISNLKGESSSTHRQDLNRQKDYEKHSYAKKAKAEGIDPKHLHQLAGEIAVHDVAHVEDRKRLLKDTRDLLTKYGYNAKALTTNLQSKKVEDNIPHLDLVARTMAKRYPDQFVNNADELDNVERLTDLLTAGNPKTMSQADAYEQALDQLRAMKDNEPPEDEGNDFGERPAEKPDEDDPFSFDFGANADNFPPKRGE